MEEERKLVSSSEATYRLHYENELGIIIVIIMTYKIK